MAGGTCGLYPSLETSRREREEREKAMLPTMIEKVALEFEGKRHIPLREYIEALEICDRQGLHTLLDVIGAYYGTEGANDEN